MWQARSVCCGTSVLPAESPDNGSGSAVSLACDGGVGGKSIVIVELIVGRNESSFRRLRQRCLNVDGHPIHLVVFVADG